MKITLDDGALVDAQSPLIVSASRSTDIPAFYSKWFFERLEKGYVRWVNPFNGKAMYISFDATKFIVFWSKNPKPLLPYYETLGERGIGSYIQYTLNDYTSEGLERSVPPLHARIETFKALSKRWGGNGVIWRFDPLLLTDSIGVPQLLSRLRRIGDELYGYTQKLVFSYADISVYRKVERNLRLSSIPYREWREDEMLYFADELQTLNKQWGYELATCCEAIDLSPYGIEHNRCVDDRLIIQRTTEQELIEKLGYSFVTDLFDSPENAITLLDGSKVYLSVKTHKKDKGQRDVCGCVVSKDIGAYNTCPHECLYCYANTSVEVARNRYMAHKRNPYGDSII